MTIVSKLGIDNVQKQQKARMNDEIDYLQQNISGLYCPIMSKLSSYGKQTVWVTKKKLKLNE